MTNIFKVTISDDSYLTRISKVRKLVLLSHKKSYRVFSGPENSPTPTQKLSCSVPYLFFKRKTVCKSLALREGEVG